MEGRVFNMRRPGSLRARKAWSTSSEEEVSGMPQWASRGWHSTPSTPGSSRVGQDKPLLKAALLKKAVRQGTVALPLSQEDSDLLVNFPTFHSISVASGSPVSSPVASRRRCSSETGLASSRHPIHFTTTSDSEEEEQEEEAHHAPPEGWGLGADLASGQEGCSQNDGGASSATEWSWSPHPHSPPPSPPEPPQEDVEAALTKALDGGDGERGRHWRHTTNAREERGLMRSVENPAEDDSSEDWTMPSSDTAGTGSAANGTGGATSATGGEEGSAARRRRKRKRRKRLSVRNKNRRGSVGLGKRHAAGLNSGVASRDMSSWRRKDGKTGTPNHSDTSTRILLDLIQELESDILLEESVEGSGGAGLGESGLVTAAGVCLNVARRPRPRARSGGEAGRCTGAISSGLLAELTQVLDRRLRERQRDHPLPAAPQPGLAFWSLISSTCPSSPLQDPRFRELLPCLRPHPSLYPFALDLASPDPEGELMESSVVLQDLAEGYARQGQEATLPLWLQQTLDLLPSGTTYGGMDSSTCLELALEGERLCKAGDCRAGVAFFEAAIQTGTDDLRTLSAIYSQLGNAYFYLGEYDKAMDYHKLDLTVARTMGDRLGVAKASGNLGNTLKVMGKFKEAICCCERHLSISQELEDKVGEGRALYNLGNVYHAQGKHLGRIGPQEPGGFSDEVKHCLQKAVEYYAANLRLMEELNDRSAQGRACGNLGNTHYLLGNFTQAISYHSERLAIAKEFGDKAAERRAHSNLGNAHIFLGKFETAADHYKKTLHLAQELGDRAVEAQACYSLGNTYTLLRDFAMAIQYHLRHLAIAEELKDKVGEGRACWSLGNAYSATNNNEKALHYATRHLEISKEIGDKTGQAAAQMNLSDIRKVLGLPPAPFDQDSAEDNKKSINEESSMDDDSFFELLSRFQSKRMDDQRCTLSIDGNKENHPNQQQKSDRPAAPPASATTQTRDHGGSLSSTGSTNGTTTPSDSGANNCGVLEELMESIAGMQSRRMDEQRASLPQLPGLNNQQVILQRLSVAASDSTPLPDDNFFDMLMRCQGSRIEDQRSSLPNESSLTHSAPTVPDDDFFSLIMRFQSGRLEDQRSTMPLEAASRSASNHRTTTDEEEPPPPAASTQPSNTSKDGLVSRLVKGRK
ncbi:G-protein-signaling modulator 1-like isoform X5 [Portunus trituberculatus]|uniref:G-protein-signaling modulator 1-like isoform X5 n=1 Tax=Portunus trituberculatus TaxID=210409 RepID=UPI001E1CB642|nr:G-protein-signaling modulator 1-like isoform X5 [Portunus trituberculatus]